MVIKDIDLTTEDIDEARKTFKNMREIAKAEMMERGTYISDRIVVPERRDKICGGHKACLIGTMYIAGGLSRFDAIHCDPDIFEADRHIYLSRKPHVEIVYNALNEAALRYLPNLTPDVDQTKERFIESTRYFAAKYYQGSLAEALFEGGQIDTDDGGMLKFLTRARRIFEQWVRESGVESGVA